MKLLSRAGLASLLVALALPANAQTTQSVVDLPSRPGVSQRILLRQTV